MSNAHGKAVEIIRERGGTIRTGEALASGIHPRTLYALRDSGQIERLARGLYRLTDAEPSTHPDLTTVAARVPAGVVCLISALAFHDLTLQIPRQVDLALPKGAWAPSLDYPPIRVYRFGGRSMTEGIQSHRIDGVEVKVFGPEKTVADCFKFRNRIGKDIAIEALRTYRRRGAVDLAGILEYAGILRIARVIRPYLEALQ